MPDPRLSSLARILVRYSVDVQPGQSVYLGGQTAAEPLLKEIFAEVIRAGGRPVVRLRLDEDRFLLLTHGTPAQYETTDPFMLHDFSTVDALISIQSDQNTMSLSQIDPARIAAWRRSMTEVMQVMNRREMEGRFRWVGSLYPTHAFAQDAKMSSAEFAEFAFMAMALDAPDPIGHWRTVSRRQAGLVEMLNEASEVRYTGPDTDITFRTAGRKWINCDGRKNFPDGEVFTSPIEDGVDGRIRFDLPAVLLGREAEDVRLTIEKGVVVEARAAKGDDFLQAMLATDEGARRIGEVAIGTNYQIDRFSRNILFDEKIGGTVHMALGMSIPETGGVNRSALHWDLIKEMRNGGCIYADGRLIYRDGRFLEEA